MTELGHLEPVMRALTTSTSLTLPTPEGTGYSAEHSAVDRRPCQWIFCYHRIIPSLRVVLRINSPIPDVLVALSSDQGLPTVDGTARSHSGLIERPCFGCCGSFSSSRQLSDCIPILPQFFPSPTVATTWPKGVMFAQGALTRQIRQDIPPDAGVGNG